MADIINLRMARKARDRQAARGAADANRAKHGQTRGEKAARALDAARLARVVDGARLDGDTD
ncbi:MAG: DUF4169 family protein [Sphingomonadales bacterium]|nr:DUF4169 family protein [Sphingomonadales bacterium]